MTTTDRRKTERSKVLVALRYTLVRQSVARLLTELGFGPVAEAESAEALFRALTHSRPDMVVMEWDLDSEGEQTINKVAAVNPKPVVVVLVPPNLQKELEPALKAGVNGYLSFNITVEELGDTLRLLGRGGLIVSEEMAGRFSGEQSTETPETPGGLSGREREVLGLVASGATNREIAEALVVTENTVKVHLRHVLDKLNLRNRQQAAAFAVREGIMVDAPEVSDQRPSNPQ